MEASVRQVNVYQYIADAIQDSVEYLMDEGIDIDVGRWQGYPTEGKPDLVTKEIINLQWTAQMPESIEEAQDMIQPNLPWAEDHFQERIGGEPTNPGFEYMNWPWWHGQDEASMPGGIFTHTYQERFWPTKRQPEGVPIGYRYAYGDLNDVISHLAQNPLSRQATFPIFFPEDTGAKHGGRIPCTLHYHFLVRNNRLQMWYPIRSCDAIRHFRDDIYMAVRLGQYVLGRLNWPMIEMGYLNFNAYSFHAHKGDLRE